MDSIRDVKRSGRRARGRNERIKYLEGQNLTRDQAIKTRFDDCTGSYAAAARNCGIKTCSLFTVGVGPLFVWDTVFVTGLPSSSRPVFLLHKLPMWYLSEITSI